MNIIIFHLFFSSQLPPPSPLCCFERGSCNVVTGDLVLQNGGTNDESIMASAGLSDMQQSGNATTKKLGFGLVGSGKRTTVPSFFNEDDDDAHKEKKMRPLVPIDYSTEELQAVQATVSGAAPPNLAAAAEFAKQISTVSSKEEKRDSEKERSRRISDRSSQRERDRNDEDFNRSRDENKERTQDRDTERERGLDKPRGAENKKLLDAKQLIDMIPRTKEELFSYEINWATYDKVSCLFRHMISIATSLSVVQFADYTMLMCDTYMYLTYPLAPSTCTG